MDKKIHRVRMRVFYKKEESIDENYNKLMPFSEKELEKIDVQNKDSEGLLIKEVIITKNKMCEKFIKRLIEILGNDKKKLIDEIDSRIDDDYFDFYVRLDKNTLELVDSGNCFHIKITPAAFPKTKENVKKVLLETFR